MATVRSPSWLLFLLSFLRAACAPQHKTTSIQRACSQKKKLKLQPVPNWALRPPCTKAKVKRQCRRGYQIHGPQLQSAKLRNVDTTSVYLGMLVYLSFHWRYVVRCRACIMRLAKNPPPFSEHSPTHATGRLGIFDRLVESSASDAPQASLA